MKLLAGPAKSLVHAKMASVLIAQVKKRGNKIIKFLQGTKVFGKTVKNATRRIGKNGKAIEIVFQDGSKIDINAARVKQWVPNTHPKAPPGSLQKVEFKNSLPGSKGYKRLPTQEELNILKQIE